MISQLCDHKFVDSNVCLKCGWSPSQPEGGKGEVTRAHREAAARAISPGSQDGAIVAEWIDGAAPVYTATYDRVAQAICDAEARGALTATAEPRVAGRSDTAGPDRIREARQLLLRMTKYVREDRAETPGATRLERLTDEVTDYLKRPPDPRSIEMLTYDEWNAAHPQAKRMSDLAHGWRSDGPSLHETLVAHRASVATALRRMRWATEHYVRELIGEINGHHYTEILHHVGHIAFEMQAMEKLTRAFLVVLRGEPDPEEHASPQPSAIEGAIAFLREAWKDNDGAEVGSIMLACGALEKLRAGGY